MSRCKNCNVEIADHAHKCPLCQHVLTNTAEDGFDTYPELRATNRKLHLASNIVLFISIVTACLLFYIDLQTGDKNPLWSVIANLCILYANVLLRLTIAGKSGYQFKTICTTAIGLLILYGIDVLTGNRGWSLNYALPIGILLMDTAILIIMIVNNRNWQSYLMSQILMILISLIPVIFVLTEVTTVKNLAFAACMASVFLFLGTLIIGDRRAREELKRRFHI